MKCPVCQETLLMTDRQGVEIDYCPKCRGVWLDRGELEKLIETSLSRSQAESQRLERRHYDDDDDYDHRERLQGRDSYRKRESWLSRILDFD